MSYYCVHSKQDYSNGYTTQEDVLTEEPGDVVPKDEKSVSGDTNHFEWFNYFSTYEEARKYLNLAIENYYRETVTNFHGDMFDRVTGEQVSIDK